jgi:hypothetical protein
MEHTTILLVDSDKTFKDDTASFLAHHGYRDIVDVNPYHEQTGVVSVSYDIAIVEFCDMIHHWHKLFPADRSHSFSRVIFTCRCHSSGTEALARAFNPAIYLIKPVSTEDVLSVVNRVHAYQHRKGNGTLLTELLHEKEACSG